MKIIDTHLHFWDPEKFGYPWLGYVPIIAAKHTPKEFLSEVPSAESMDWVFVQAECRSEQALQEVEWVSEFSRKYPQIRGIVAYAPMDKGEKTEKWLKELERFPLVKGIRHHLQLVEDASFCWKAPFIEGMNQLAKRGLVFDICLKNHQIQDAIKMVEKSQQTTFVLDHFGSASLKDKSFQHWKEDLKVLSSFSNVSVKLSGLLTQTPSPVPPKELTAVFETVIEAFGSSRLLFGSDWPVVKLNGSYQVWVDMVKREISSLSSQDQEAVFCGNAGRIYRLK